MFAVLAGLAPAAVAAPPEVAATAPPRLVMPDFSRRVAHPVVDVPAADLVVVDVAGVRTRIRLLGVAPVSRRSAGGQAAQRYLANLLRGESVYIEQELESPRPTARPSATEVDATTPADGEDTTAPTDATAVTASSGTARIATEPDADEPGETRAPTPLSELATTAYLYRAPDGLFVNLELVRQGFARPDRARPLRYSEVFAYYDAAARKHQRGQWDPAGPWNAPPPPAAPAAEASPAPTAPATAAQPAPAAAPADAVYVTPTGTRYHRANCSFLRDDRVGLTLQEAKDRGLKPCTRCRPPE